VDCHRHGGAAARQTHLEEQPVITFRPVQRLLAGPPLDGRPEGYGAHVARLGKLPRPADPSEFIAVLEASGLRGRGGAGFPVGRKWRSVAERAKGHAVVVANGAEGEPMSAKDRTLMAHRPHLVVDGAVLAAGAVGADEIVFYVGGEHRAAVAAIGRAIEERSGDVLPQLRLVEAPAGYVAGEESAAVHWIDGGDARPTSTPPRVFERGVGGRSTLVQNVESLAHAALIARFGDRWYRSAGRLETRGTALVTVSGAVRRPWIGEIEIGTTVAEVVDAAGGPAGDVGAALLGGYFGTWARAGDAWDLPLDPGEMRAHGLTFGCGIVGLLPAGACGVAATAEVIAFMAAESAGQCGPCLFGLGAIADATARIAAGAAGAADLDEVERRTAMLAGRGACRHPDGAAQLMASALAVFGEDFASHAQRGRCAVDGSRVEVA
jgi:NADH:ubiquinone oxidoreductase subunit F (NADH-binding)